MNRRKTLVVNVDGIKIGGNNPVVIQSMTSVPTSAIQSTLKQTIELIEAGSELVRWTINDDKAAIAAIKIIKLLREKEYTTPIVGDFHFNGHILLDHHPECARLLSKYRINPGNVGRGNNHDNNFAKIIRIAMRNNKPVRIGVNGGSLDPEMLASLMEKNAKKTKLSTSGEVITEAMIKSALSSANYAVKLGLPKNKIILSAKMSELQDMIKVYTNLSKKCNFPLHLGLTEAGSDLEGITSSSAALSILLQQGIGDTIRVSLTPQPKVKRSREVEVCKSILQSLGFRHFSPKITSCPGCGRTTSKAFQDLANDIKSYIKINLSTWEKKYPKVKHLKIAVMGCVVNGPGESKSADIGISLPGTSETPVAPVYVNGKKIATLKGKHIKNQFLKILEKYIKEKHN